AEPPAESPSTMKISDSAGLREEQSRSLPGIPPVSSGDLRRVASRAFRAASRAAAAAWPFITMALASAGWDSNQSCSWSVITLTMKVRATRSEEHTSELQSRFDLVCRLLLEKKKKNT